MAVAGGFGNPLALAKNGWQKTRACLERSCFLPSIFCRFLSAPGAHRSIDISICVLAHLARNTQLRDGLTSANRGINGYAQYVLAAAPAIEFALSGEHRETVDSRLIGRVDS